MRHTPKRHREPGRSGRETLPGVRGVRFLWEQAVAHVGIAEAVGEGGAVEDGPERGAIRWGDRPQRPESAGRLDDGYGDGVQHLGRWCGIAHQCQGVQLGGIRRPRELDPAPDGRYPLTYKRSGQISRFGPSLPF
jgi:hypothetical protein